MYGSGVGPAIFVQLLAGKAHVELVLPKVLRKGPGEGSWGSVLGKRPEEGSSGRLLGKRPE
jgi:hypothetical protein